MVNKKIILSILIIGCIATVAGAGTWAYFDDTQSVYTNTVNTGTVDLIPGSSGLDAFTISNIVPGQSNSAAKTVSVKNNGNVDARLYAKITTSGPYIPELSVKLADTPMTYTGQIIELGTLPAGQEKSIVIGYDYIDSNGDQNYQQNQQITYDITYHLTTSTTMSP